MEEIKNLLRKGETDAALDRLILDFRETDFENDFIQLSARSFAHQRDLSRGLIDYGDFQMNQNRVMHDTLTLMEAIAKSRTRHSTPAGAELRTRKVAFCEANPLERNLLSNVEARELQALFSRGSERLQLSLHFALSMDDFLQTVNALQPEIIHFSAFANAEGIYFHDRQDQPVQVGNDMLALHMAGLAKKPECIFFNTFIAPELARKLSGEDIFVVGFDDIIDSYAAIAFATGFYTALAYGKDYPAAYAIGRQTLSNGKYVKNASNLYAFQHEEKC